ncbi:hypothetical protein LCGC14_0853150 [marine sediment metagenome]|uniref:Uncharacterized protein n=1 Tax=marine sediment metagenome TaxID=412755 RepID=A0A0F9SGQ2_9ZZZZ
MGDDYPRFFCPTCERLRGGGIKHEGTYICMDCGSKLESSEPHREMVEWERRNTVQKMHNVPGAGGDGDKAG